MLVLYGLAILIGLCIAALWVCYTPGGMHKAMCLKKGEEK